MGPQPASPERPAPASHITEELFNSLTHGLGLVLSIPGLILLLTAATVEGGAGRVVCGAVFGGALVLMYAASVLYHSFPVSPLKRLLRVVDHVAIYVLIAGTYTPFLLLVLEGGWGRTMLFLVWGLALAGAVFKIFFTGRYMRLSTLFYVLMGWLAVLLIKPLLISLPLGGLLWLVGGGLCYTGGVVFFVWESLPYNHAIWHLFVLAGSLCHYIAVLHYALPA